MKTLQPPTDFPTNLPDTLPEALRKRCADWNTATAELVATVNEAGQACELRRAALARGLPPGDRMAPRRYREALELLQEVVATLPPLVEVTREALGKALTAANREAAKAVATMVGRLETLGYEPADAAAMATGHPSARRAAAAAMLADRELCTLPNPKAGPCLRLQLDVDEALIQLEG